MSLLKVGKDFIRYKLFGEETPLSVSISITNRCNLRCSYCNIYERDTAEMKTNEILEILDDIDNMGGYRVGFWGGEPLVRDDIGELVGRALENGLFTTLISNGVLVPEKIDELKGLDTLFLSLDGPRDLHENNRGKGTYDKAIDAIKVAQEKGIPVCTITVLTGDDEEKIDFILDRAEEMGFSCTFQLIYRDEVVSAPSAEKAPDYGPVVEKLIEEKEKGRPVASSKSYLEHLLEWEDYAQTAIYPSEEEKLECFGGKLYCNIDTDGRVYPCDWVIGRIEEPNASEIGFEKAWKRMKPAEKCGGCLKSCYSEYNLMFSPRFEAIRNAVRLVTNK